MTGMVDGGCSLLRSGRQSALVVLKCLEGREDASSLGVVKWGVAALCGYHATSVGPRLALCSLLIQT